MSKMKLVYIAGPFRGPTPWDVAQNVRRAEEVGLEVSRRGYFPVIPHANTHLFHGQGEDEFWLEGTLELLRRCDAVVATPDWERSSGARAELEEARRLRIPQLPSPAVLPPAERFDAAFSYYRNENPKYAVELTRVGALKGDVTIKKRGEVITAFTLPGPMTEVYPQEINALLELFEKALNEKEDEA